MRNWLRSPVALLILAGLVLVALTAYHQRTQKVVLVTFEGPWAFAPDPNDPNHVFAFAPKTKSHHDLVVETGLAPAQTRQGASLRPERRAITAESPQPGEDVLADHRIHVARIGVLEAVPAVILKGTLLAVLPPGEEPLLHRLLFAISLQFLGNFLFVQSLEKKKVGNLLNNFERVGDTARPESIPDLIDLTANFAGKHKLWGGSNQEY
jgi:hypothetical protein